MEEIKIPIADQTFSIGNPSVDKTLRITDELADILEEAPELAVEIDAFRNQYRKDNQGVLTLEQFKDPNNKNVVEALQKTPDGELLNEDFYENEDNLATDKKGNKGFPYYSNPTVEEIAVKFFPKIYKSFKEPILDIIALTTITNGELETHDKQNTVDDLISNRARWIRHNARTKDLLNIIVASIAIIKEEIESTSEALGKVTEDLVSLTTQTTQTQQNESEEPKEEQNDGLL